MLGLSANWMGPVSAVHKPGVPSITGGDCLQAVPCDSRHGSGVGVGLLLLSSQRPVLPAIIVRAMLRRDVKGTSHQAWGRKEGSPLTGLCHKVVHGCCTLAYHG